MNRISLSRCLAASLLIMAFDAPLFSRSDSKESDSIKYHYTIDEVVVTGSRSQTDIRYLPMTVSVIGKENIARRYESSVLPILTEQVPGLFVTSRSIMGYGVAAGAAGGMTMRGIGGSPTTALLTLIDGEPQYMGLMGHTIADSFQSLLAERVEVLRGPASMLYGSNAMGGVINIVTRKMVQDGSKTNLRAMYGSYNTLMSDVLNQSRWGKFSSTVALSYNRTDGNRDRMKYDQFNSFVKLGYDFTPHWRLAADVNVLHFNASNPGSVSTPVYDNDSHITRGMTSLALENHQQRLTGAFKLYYNWGHHKINDGYTTGGTPKDYLYYSNDHLWGISAYQTMHLSSSSHLTLGFDYQGIGGRAWNEFQKGTTTVLTDTLVNEVAGYADFSQRLASWVNIEVGVRVDHHSVSGTQWVPQGGLSFFLPRNAQLKLMVSKGFRNPTLRELFMFRPKNPALSPEKVMNYELSFTQHALQDRLFYQASLFYIDGDNLIQTVITNGKPLNQNTGTVKNWGFELQADYNLTSEWNIHTNYSFLHMKYPVLASPKHKLYAGTDYTHGHWSLATGLQYIAGLYTALTPQTKTQYLLWNARVTYNLSRSASFFARGENLLAQRYEINAGYPMPRATVMAGFSLNF